MAHYIDINSREFVHILSNMDPRWKPWAEMTKDEYKEARAELNSFAEAILALPAADVVEARHGKWIKAPCSEKDGNAHCSVCDHWDWSDCKYCSECGAKMTD